MIGPDELTTSCETQVREAVTSELDPVLLEAVNQFLDAAHNLLNAAGCEDVTEFLHEAELLEALLAGIPWDEVAQARAEREGYALRTDPTDGLDYYYREAG